MKKLVLLVMLVSVSVFGQETYVEEVSSDPNSELTQEEYNYLTKGLRVQEESGLDMKKGYELKMLAYKKVNRYTFTSKIFIETATNIVKGISVKIESGVTNKAYYLVIPSTVGKYTDEYNKLLMTFEQPMAQSYTIFLSDALRSYASYAYRIGAQKPMKLNSLNLPTKQ